jgi:predicted O-methyltransferase YrrM
MPRSPLGLSTKIEEYLNVQKPEHPVLAALRERTEPLEWARMQIAPNQAEYIRWLIATIRAKRTIEIGVFTGYSTLATALELPADGTILACDVSEEWTAMGREHWKLAGVDHKIDLVLAPALETLNARILAGESNSYDFAFVDADKENYLGYFEACVRLVRSGGVIMFDNMLWGGAVAEKTEQAPSTLALREVNRRVLSDRRVRASLVPVGDGLLLATVC